MLKKTLIDKLSFTTGSFTSVCDFLASEIATGKQGHIVLPCSLHDLAQANKKTKSAYRKVDILLPDGVPLVWLMRARGGDTERMYGPDIMRALLRAQQLKKIRHVFYGSSTATLERLVFHARAVGIRGDILTISPPYRTLTTQEEKSFVSQIRRFRPDCMWIGLSSPKQVELAVRWKKYFPKTTIFCVGAAFDILAGTVPQAPRILRQLGLEWAFRLCTNPRRLWKRYLIEIPTYLIQKLSSRLLTVVG